MRTHIAMIMLALALCACGIPRDPESTLARVSGGTMYVGVTNSPPWVELGDAEPNGVEVQIDWRLHDIVIMPASAIDDGRADTE
ncbi:MAG: hypothetical protein ACRDJ2_04025 [Actinomycetota bacterium]